MCGIIGCKLQRPLNEEDIERLRGMREAMAYRGPDDAGEYVEKDNGLYLGHRRLSIIDLDTRSAQPMKDEDNVLIYNGEIYNYLEIKDEVGGDFKTESDTEVILKAWQEWGPDALEKFDGMFAFALKDKDGLHLATDPFGEKPLYLYKHSDGIYFSSEAGPLIEAFDIPFTPDEEDYADFLYLGFMRPPKTGFQNLRNIAPAQYLRIADDGTVSEKTYWRLPAPHIGKGKIPELSENIIAQTRDHLCTSLQRRLRSDVPLGLFLSGGVDSALVGALAKKELGYNLKAYTVSFPDGADETEYAARIADYLGIEHTPIDSREDAMAAGAPESLLDIYGIANDNMTALSTYQMCKAAKEHLTVALSGLGGDELFYGYNKYDTFYNNRTIYAQAEAFGALGSFLAAFPSKRLKNYNDLLKGNDDRRYLRIKNGASQNDLEALYSHLPEDLLPSAPQGMVHKVRCFDLFHTLAQSQIPAFDRGSMRASVEVRTPFLNKALAEYLWSLDQRALIAHGKKELARKLLSAYMPLDLLNKSKQGFVFPLARYYKDNEPGDLRALPFDKDDINNILKNAGKPEYERLALRLLLLDKLHQKHGRA